MEYDESQFIDIRKSINNKLGSSFFDNWHSEIRLHGSINKWVANDGRQMNRMKFELNLIELNTMTIYEILNKSEKLAYEYLSSIK